MADEHDYEIGFQKPPKHSQWKSGQSGNPKGRPKKIKDFEKLLDIELSKSFRITECGQQVTLTKREVILKSLVNNALKGEYRAVKILLPFIAKQETVEGFDPDAADRRTFEQLVRQLGKADGHPEKETGND